MPDRPVNRSIYVPARNVALLKEVEEMCRALGTNLSAAVIEGLRSWKEAHARQYLLAAIEQESGRLKELDASPGAAKRERAALEARLRELRAGLRHLEATTPEGERLLALGQALLGLAVEHCPGELARLLAASEPRPAASRRAAAEPEGQVFDF